MFIFLLFKSPAKVPKWMGGHDTLQMCMPVCVCVRECAIASDPDFMSMPIR